MLEIKLIEVDGSFKALVLDMSKTENRLVFMASNNDKDAAYDEAEAYVKANKAVTWH